MCLIKAVVFMISFFGCDKLIFYSRFLARVVYSSISIIFDFLVLSLFSFFCFCVVFFFFPLGFNSNGLCCLCLFDFK